MRIIYIYIHIYIHIQMVSSSASLSIFFLLLFVAPKRVPSGQDIGVTRLCASSKPPHDSCSSAHVAAAVSPVWVCVCVWVCVYVGVCVCGCVCVWVCVWVGVYEKEREREV